jgi:hypothetical protein
MALSCLEINRMSFGRMGSLGKGFGRLGSPLGRPTAYTFVNSEAAALVARFTAPPPDARKALIDAWWTPVKASGAHLVLDGFHFEAGADSQSARLNWIQAAYDLTPVSSPTFVADRGYTGDGAASYLDTGFNPTTASSPKFTLNSACVGFFSRTDATFSTYFDVGNTNARLNSRSNNANQPRGLVNDGTTANFGATANSIGMYAINRSGASARQFYRNGSLLGSDTAAATALSNETIKVLMAGNAFSIRQGLASYWGASLTADQHLAIYNATLTLAQAIGAA